MGVPGCRASAWASSSGKVTERERMLEAYRWASCLTERCWDPTEVSRSVSPIYRFLNKISDERQDFAFLVSCLEQQIVNIGLHPMNCTPDQRAARLELARKNGHGGPLVEEVVAAAKELLKYVTED